MSDGIRAGKAYVELGVQNNLRRGLAQAEGTLKNWAGKVASYGAAMTGVASAGVGAFVSMAKGFADAGSQIYDMSKSTGVAAESLSALKYAAEQNGSSLETVGKSMGALNKFTTKLSGGNKEAAKTLKDMGIDAKAFMAAAPEDRLGMIADGLAGISDEGVRAGMAMKVLGKGGAELLPMLDGGSEALKKTTDEARALGLVLSDQDAAKADDLGDAWDKVKSAFNAIGTKLGGAVATTLTSVLNAAIPLIVAVGDFVTKNQDLVVAIFAGIAAVGAIGAALTLAAGAMFIAGTALGVISAVIGGIVAAVTFLLSPMGIFLALVAGGIAYLLLFTEEGQWLVSTLSSGFTDLFGIFKSTFGGIVDALSAGQLELAGQIAMAGFNAAMLKGYAIFQSIWSGFKVWLVNIFVDAFNLVLKHTGGMLRNLAFMLADLGQKELGGAILIASMNGGSLGRLAAEKFKEQENEKVKQAQADAQMSKDSLDRLTAEAAKAKAESQRKKEDEGKAKYGLPTLSGAGGIGTVSGAFLASASALLGQSQTSLSEKQLKATEESNEKLDKLIEVTEDLDQRWSA